MESNVGRVVPGDERVSASEGQSFQYELPAAGPGSGTPIEAHIGQYADWYPVHEPEHIHNEACGHCPTPEPTVVEHPAQESDGPEQPTGPITLRQLRKLRGQYFTVRHIPLPCGHKLDVINEPTHVNCDDCWFHFFNTHPQLVETANAAWREQGKEFVIRLRGKKFAKKFAQFIVTVVALKQEQEKQREQSNGNVGESGSGVSGGDGEAQQAGNLGTSVSSGEVPSVDGSGQVAQ